jgi:type IV secretory pathway VirB3-like protein
MLVNVAIIWIRFMEWNFMKLWKSHITKWHSSEGINTFGLIGSCCQSMLCSLPITRGCRWFKLPSRIPPHQEIAEQLREISFMCWEKYQQNVTQVVVIEEWRATSYQPIPITWKLAHNWYLLVCLFVHETWEQLWLGDHNTFSWALTWS